MFLLPAAELRGLFRGDSALNSCPWGALQSYRQNRCLGTNILIFDINASSLFMSSELSLTILYPSELTLLVACCDTYFMVLFLSVKNSLF